MQELITHPKGESQGGALLPVSGAVAVDTFAGRIHVDWNPDAAVTPLGQLPFFIEFLHVSGLFDDWVAQCPLGWTSPNAPRSLSDLTYQHFCCHPAQRRRRSKEGFATG